MALLVCVSCAARHPVNPATWRCPCGGVLDLDGPSGVVPIAIGAVETPVVPLADETIDLHLKLEGMLPSGSFKDRGSAVLVGLLAAAGVEHAVADSSGNAGASIAAHCAAAGIALDLYVPASASPAKLVQAVVHGATVHRVPGVRADAAAAAGRAVADGAVYATHGWSPLFCEGTASFARELLAQLDVPPDALVVPVGSGTLLLGAWSVLRTLPRPPRLIAVQSDACAPLAATFAGEPLPDVRPGAAEGVLVAHPPRGSQVIAAVRESGGTIVRVGDDRLAAALRRLGAAGVFAEPTAALGIAALPSLLADGDLRPGERVACAVTGHGLKAAATIEGLV
jgi:threonine synthase